MSVEPVNTPALFESVSPCLHPSVGGLLLLLLRFSPAAERHSITRASSSSTSSLSVRLHSFIPTIHSPSGVRCLPAVREESPDHWGSVFSSGCTFCSFYYLLSLKHLRGTDTRVSTKLLIPALFLFPLTIYTKLTSWH